VDMLTQCLRQRGEVLLVGHVELDHRHRLGQPVDDPPGDPQRPAEVRYDDRRALLLGDPGDLEADRGVHRHPRDQDALALENAHDSLSLDRCSLQWPMPRPPSTGITAPVTYAAPGEASQVTAAATSSVLA